MSKINKIRLTLDLICTIVLLMIFPFNIERKIKLLLLYIFSMVIAGRFRTKTLLIYDELRLLVIGYAGFLFTAVLTVAFRSATAWNEIGYIFGFTILDFLCSLVITRYTHIWFHKQTKENVLIVGAGPSAAKLDWVTKANRFSLMDVKGFVNCNNNPQYPSAHQPIVEQSAPIITVDEMNNYIDAYDINTVLIAIPQLDQKDLQKLSRELARKVDNVRYLPSTEGMVNFASKVDDFDGVLMISTTQGRMSTLSKVLKRTIDIAGGLAGCLILAPLSVFVYFYNRKCGDKGPLVFTQNRIGKNGKEFKVYKFRTMVVGADKILEDLMASDPAVREEYEKNKKLQNDPRITKAGHFLREKSLDEFPQFINVLKGQMSLIGPRPYLPREAKDMGEYYTDIVSMAPGVTGMWQTHGRSSVSFEERLELDQFYYRNWSLWLDLTLLVKTMQTMLLGDHNAV